MLEILRMFDCKNTFQNQICIIMQINTQSEFLNWKDLW